MTKDQKGEQDMIEAVIFDLDGLLIDSEVVSYQLFRDLIEPYGHSFTVEDYAQNFSGKMAVRNMEVMIERYQLPISVQEGLDFAVSQEQVYFKEGVKLKTGARELLDYLKQNDYKIVLASSSTRQRAVDALAQNNVNHYFDEMVFGAEVENGKPSPDIFLKASKKVNVSPENCLVLEDSEAGIQAAFSAHIPVICVLDMKAPEAAFQEMTAAVMSSLLEVIPYLKKK